MNLRAWNNPETTTPVYKIITGILLLLISFIISKPLNETFQTIGVFLIVMGLLKIIENIVVTKNE